MVFCRLPQPGDYEGGLTASESIVNLVYSERLKEKGARLKVKGERTKDKGGRRKAGKLVGLNAGKPGSK